MRKNWLLFPAKLFVVFFLPSLFTLLVTQEGCGREGVYFGSRHDRFAINPLTVRLNAYKVCEPAWGGWFNTCQERPVAEGRWFYEELFLRAEGKTFPAVMFLLLGAPLMFLFRPRRWQWFLYGPAWLAGLLPVIWFFSTALSRAG
ncbi:MAG: hypothetical protein ABSC29_01510 [Minisyncoccia bacterium]|jgi:hypothetical protein